jgi:glycosyltransferase involved in cell wall biosynthesis
MVSKDKLISVIIPVYNGERYLGEAIESVLAQCYRPIEVIVVNDGSKDNTETIAGRYADHIIYTRQENRGPAAARNRGLQMSQGEVIGFLDADDLWSENKLSLQLACLAEDHSVEIVVGLSQPMRLRSYKDGKAMFEKWYDPFCALLLSAALFRKSVFEKVGLFDETLHYGEDTDWFMRIREMGISMTLIQEVGLYYRRHESNMTLDSVARNRCFIKALKKSLDRRRKEGQGSVSSLPKLTGIESAAGHTQEQPDSSSPRSE